MTKVFAGVVHFFEGRSGVYLLDQDTRALVAGLRYEKAEGGWQLTPASAVDHPEYEQTTFYAESPEVGVRTWAALLGLDVTGYEERYSPTYDREFS